MPNCETCGKMFEPRFGSGNAASSAAPLKCPECSGENLGSVPPPRNSSRQDAAQFAAELNQIAPAQPLVTWVLIAICTAVFVVEIIKGAGFDTMSPDLAIRLGADYGPLTLTGQWWRLFTSMFLHFGFLHLGMNMWCLWALGALAERLMGRAAFLLLYVASGLAGSLISVSVHPQIVSAGASGAVFGIAGGLITYLLLKKAPLDFARAKKQLTNLALFVGINFFYSLQPGIDMTAHIGGLASGLAIAAALPRFLEIPGAQTIPSPFLEKSSVSKRITEVGIVCAIAILLAAVGIHRMQTDSIFVLGSLNQIDEGQSAAVIPQLEKIVARKPGNAMAHFALGAAYLRTNKIDDAVRELLRSENLESGNTTVEQELGAAYLAQQDFDSAMAAFRHSIASDANNTGAHLGLATALLAEHQDQEAATEARKVLAASPKDSEAQVILTQAEMRLGTKP